MAKSEWFTYSGVYPRGDSYTHTRVFLGSMHDLGGGYSHTAEGFLPFGAKKLSTTERDARKRVLKRMRQRLNKASAELTTLEGEASTA